MKRFLLIIAFTLLSISALPTKADIIPTTTKSIKHYGIGVLNMPKTFKVYSEPNFNSNVIQEINYEELKKSSIIRSSETKKLSYVVYVPSNKVALLTVDDIDNNWYSVFINQSTGEKGWIYTDNNTDFMTYRTLFYRYGKKYGVRLFNDLKDTEKVLYAKEDKSSKVLEELKFPKFITFTVLRGNWILLSVNDMTKQAKIGWFNWRNDNGTLNMFPNFKEQS